MDFQAPLLWALEWMPVWKDHQEAVHVLGVRTTMWRVDAILWNFLKKHTNMTWEDQRLPCESFQASGGQCSKSSLTGISFYLGPALDGNDLRASLLYTREAVG